MNLTKNGVTIEIADAAVVDIVLQRLTGERYPTNLSTIALPRIGAPWRDGHFVGLARGFDGKPDMAVELLPYAPKKMNHADGKKYAESVGGVLMTRRTAPLCFANVPELFEKAWHWLDEQYEGGGGYAWIQGFVGGSQISGRKDDEYHVRPVRLVDPSMIR